MRGFAFNASLVKLTFINSTFQVVNVGSVYELLVIKKKTAVKKSAANYYQAVIMRHFSRELFDFFSHLQNQQNLPVKYSSPIILTNCEVTSDFLAFFTSSKFIFFIFLSKRHFLLKSYSQLSLVVNRLFFYRIINIMQNKASGYPNWAGISKPVNAVFTVDAPGLLFIESTHNNATGYVTINGFQMIYGSGNGFATNYYCVTYLVDSGDVVKTTDATGRVILFVFKTKV
nr:MAG: hypothetical protein [Bacteriophage sp.]